MISAEHFQTYMFDDSAYDPGFACFHQSMYNYLIHGLHPGSGYTAILANDLFLASQNLHPQIQDLLHVFTHWVIYCAPSQSFGSYQAVDDWCRDLDGRRSKYTEMLSRQMSQLILSGEESEHGPVHGSLIMG